MKIVLLFVALLSLNAWSEDYVPQSSNTQNSIIKNANKSGCPMSSDEKLACGVVLCNPLGLVISESRSECLDINKKWAIYLATLGPFDSPVRCRSRDMSCTKRGVIKEVNYDYCSRSFSGDDWEFCINNAIDTKCDGTTGGRLDGCGQAVREGRNTYYYNGSLYYVDEKEQDGGG
jgi:hypothetical protein